MKQTPVKLLNEQIKYYKTFRQIIIDKYRNGEIVELKKDSLICDVDEKIQEFEFAVKILNETIVSKVSNCKSTGAMPLFQKFLELFGYNSKDLGITITTKRN